VCAGQGKCVHGHTQRHRNHPEEDNDDDNGDDDDDGDDDDGLTPEGAQPIRRI